MKNILKQTLKSSLKRRSFLKGSGAVGAAAIAGAGLPFKALAEDVESQSEETSVWSSCTVNYGSRCVLRHHVKDGVIVSTETDNTAGRSHLALTFK